MFFALCFKHLSNIVLRDQTSKSFTEGAADKLYVKAAQNTDNPKNRITFPVFIENNSSSFIENNSSLEKKEMLIIIKETKIEVISNRLDIFEQTNR